VRFALCCLLAACSQPGPATCVDPPPAGCAPLYSPTYDEIFTRTLQPTCGKSGSSCHSAQGAQGGLVFENADDAYRRLTDPNRPRVVPGDPACSMMIERLSSDDPMRRMPPGRALSEPERCSISKWIEAGAKR
jgi:hypothetical protein